MMDHKQEMVIMARKNGKTKMRTKLIAWHQLKSLGVCVDDDGMFRFSQPLSKDSLFLVMELIRSFDD